MNRYRFFKCEWKAFFYIFDWIHYAFGILKMMGLPFPPFLSLNVRWDRLMEKQIKLITFEPQNDTNKTSLEKWTKEL